MSIFSKLWEKITGQHNPESPAAAVANAPVPTSQPAAVDIEAVLEGMASQSNQKLNWRTSIVDLMKLVGLDSSIAARKELASELGYKPDTADSAAMNIWLHNAVMKKISENGGRVPPELLN